MKTKRNGSITNESFKWSMDRSHHLCFGGISRECSRFFSQTAERLANRRKGPKCKTSAWITRTPSNVDNINEIDLCPIVTESNIE